MRVVSFKTRFFLTSLIFILLQGLSSVGATPAEKKILVTPFQITSEDNLDFLRKGLKGMLEARLTEPGYSNVVFGVDAGAAKALGADYIVQGTILIFGSQVSTDVKLLSLDSGEVELAFNEMGTQKGDVIKHVDLFAENIRTRVLGLAPVAGLLPVAPVAGSNSGYIGPAGVNQSVSKPNRARVIWRSPFLKKETSSIVVADIDNDGNNETLVLSGSNLEIFRRDPNGFTLISENKLENSVGINYLFVDAYDVDKDGKKEILITGINRKQLHPASYVYKYDKGTMVKIIGPESYFIRAVETSAGPILLGQKVKGSGEKKMNARVVELKLGPGGNSLARGEKTFPFADNVFGIAFGDFMNDNTETIAVLDLDGLISIHSPNGESLHESSDVYGGTPAYIEYKGARYNKDDGYVLSRIFLQQRIFAADIDGDGKTNLIVVKNIDDTSGYLARTRLFTKCFVDVLLWNELGFESRDKSQNISGYIADYTVADMNNDGKDEIVFAVVSPPKMLKSPRSQIFSKR